MKNTSFGKTVGQISPILYLIIYLILVPAYATIYALMPKSFYAPYAKYEPSATEDRRLTEKSILQAIKKHAIGKSSLGAEFANVANLEHKTGDRLKFTLWISTPYLDHKVIQAVIPAIGDFYHSVILPSKEIRNSICLTLDLSIAENHFDPKDEIVRVFVETFPKIENARCLPLTEEQAKNITAFISGVEGDALAVSNSFERMMYFSSVVITTTGFGDIVPITPISRLITASEALSGITVIGLFLNSLAAKISKRSAEP